MSTKTQTHTIEGDGLAQSVKGSSIASMGSRLQPALPSSKTYRVQGIPTSYSYKSTKRHLELVLGLDGTGSCVQIHSLAASPYYPKRENVATVTFNAGLPALTDKQAEWRFPFIGGEDSRGGFPVERPEITIDTHFEGFTTLNVISGDHKIEYVRFNLVEWVSSNVREQLCRDYWSSRARLWLLEGTRRWAHVA